LPESNVLLLENLSPQMARKILREIVEGYTDRMFISGHCRQRMVERQITDKQIMCCIRNGTFKEEPYWSPKGNWEMKLEVISSGDIITAVVAIDHDADGNFILVITTF